MAERTKNAQHGAGRAVKASASGAAAHVGFEVLGKGGVGPALKAMAANPGVVAASVLVPHAVKALAEKVQAKVDGRQGVTKKPLEPSEKKR